MSTSADANSVSNKPAVSAGDASPELEVDRASAAVDACESPMQKYRQLVTLQNTDERAFYALLERRTAEERVRKRN